MGTQNWGTRGRGFGSRDWERETRAEVWGTTRTGNEGNCRLGDQGTTSGGEQPRIGERRWGDPKGRSRKLGTERCWQQGLRGTGGAEGGTRSRPIPPVC